MDYIVSLDDGKGYSKYFRLQEGCNYTLAFKGGDVSISRVSGSDNSYSPIWGSILLFLGLQIIYSISIFFIQKRKEKLEPIENQNFEENSPEETEKKRERKKERLNSLDQSSKIINGCRLSTINYR